MTMPQVDRLVESTGLGSLGLCTNSTVAYTESSEEDKPRGFACNADVVGDAARDAARAALTKKMYSRTRSSSFPFEVSGRSLLKRRGSTEGFNYAKALMQSDAELEKMALKIRSDIRQYEMSELAQEAERAANAGQESFYGRASTFGSDTNSPKRPGADESNPGTMSHKTSVENTKIKVLSLRDISEVIPSWGELHSHLRTHLHRRKVHEKSLVFSETAITGKEPQIEHGAKGAADETDRQSFSFFDNFQWPNGMMQGGRVCDTPALEDMVDDGSESTVSSVSGIIGPVLSSHLSPSKGSKSLRPELIMPPGLMHLHGTEENYSSLAIPPLPGVSKAKGASERTQSQSQHGSGQAKANDGLLETVLSSSTDGDTGANNDDSPETSPKTPILLEKAADPVALFDEDDDVSSCPSSPVRTNNLSEHPLKGLSELDPSIMLTPREEDVSAHKDSHFVTPAHLRNIKALKNRGSKAGEFGFSTPDSAKVTFEPSSILATGGCDHSSQERQAVSPLHEQESLYLSLPAIQNAPNDRPFDRSKRLAQTALKRRPRFLQRQLPPQGSPDLARSISSPLRVKSRIRITQKETGSMETEHGTRGNPADETDSKVSTQSQQQIVDSQTESPNKTAFLIAMDTPISPRTLHETDGHLKFDEGRQDDPADEKKQDEKEVFKLVGGSFEENKEYDEDHDPDRQITAVVQVEIPLGDAQPGTTHTAREQDSSSCDVLESRKSFETDCSHDGSQASRNSLVVGVEPQADSTSSTKPSPLQMAGIDLASAGCQIMSNRGELICHSFQSTEESFQAAVQGMIEGISSSPRRRMRKSYYSARENRAFLNNYFYCVKPQHALKPLQEETHSEPICHNLGVDTMCSGLTFLFARSDSLQIDQMQHREVERTLSLGKESVNTEKQDGWLEMLGVFSNQNNVSGNEIGRTAYKPPNLKNISKTTPVKEAHGTLISRFPSTIIGSFSVDEVDEDVEEASYSISPSS